MAIKYIEKAEVPFIMNGLSDEFALVENPGYIFPKFEVVPLAKKLKSVTELEAVVVPDKTNNRQNDQGNMGGSR